MTVQERLAIEIADDQRLARLEAHEADLARPMPMSPGAQIGADSVEPFLAGIDDRLRESAR